MERSDYMALRQLDRLIRYRSTGNPATLARRIGVREKNLPCLLRRLSRELRRTIAYSEVLQSYYYETPSGRRGNPGFEGGAAPAMPVMA